MVEINPTVSVITLNVIDLRQIVRVDFKKDPNICCLQETHIKYKNSDRLQIEGKRKIYQSNTNQKRDGTATLILDHANFKIMKIFKDKENHYIMTYR